MNNEITLLTGILSEDALDASLQAHINEKGQVEIKVSGYSSVKLSVKRNPQTTKHSTISVKSNTDLKNQQIDIFETAVESSQQIQENTKIERPPAKEGSETFPIPEWIPLENKKDFLESCVAFLKIICGSNGQSLLSSGEFSIRDNEIKYHENSHQSSTISPPAYEVLKFPQTDAESQSCTEMKSLGDKSTETDNSDIESGVISMRKIADHYEMQLCKSDLTVTLQREGVRFPTRQQHVIPENIARASYEAKLSAIQMITHMHEKIGQPFNARQFSIIRK